MEVELTEISSDNESADGLCSSDNDLKENDVINSKERRRNTVDNNDVDDENHFDEDDDYSKYSGCGMFSNRDIFLLISRITY